MKKLIAMLMVLVLAVSMLAACGGSQNPSSDTKESQTEEASKEDTKAPEQSSEEESKSAEGKAVKMGFIMLHDENSTYDLNFINAAKAACEAAGLKENEDYFIKTGIPESAECLTAAEDLIDQGCNVIFADSFGHEDYLIEGAKKYPDVEFCHATGTKAHTEGLSNYHNAFASIYEGRYLAGIAAGMKLNEMIESGKITADKALVGYVGAFTYAEVISGLTSFYLGVTSICESATMQVQFTGSWYDYQKEKEAAQTLISNGCVLVSGHADSLGAPQACEEAGVPNISYNGSTEAAGPNTYIVSSKINWAPYFEYIINCVKEGKAIDADYTGTLATDSVQLLDLSGNAAPGTAEKIEEAKKALEAGTLHVFDISKFTVKDVENANASLDADGHLLGYKADVDSDANYEADTEVVKDGYFHESEYRSAPYFDIQIDGITFNNVAF